MRSPSFALTDSLAIESPHFSNQYQDVKLRSNQCSSIRLPLSELGLRVSTEVIDPISVWQDNVDHAADRRGAQTPPSSRPWIKLTPYNPKGACNGRSAAGTFLPAERAGPGPDAGPSCLAAAFLHPAR